MVAQRTRNLPATICIESMWVSLLLLHLKQGFPGNYSRVFLFLGETTVYRPSFIAGLWKNFWLWIRVNPVPQVGSTGPWQETTSLFWILCKSFYSNNWNHILQYIIWNTEQNHLMQNLQNNFLVKLIFVLIWIRLIQNLLKTWTFQKFEYSKILKLNFKNLNFWVDLNLWAAVQLLVLQGRLHRLGVFIFQDAQYQSRCWLLLLEQFQKHKKPLV